MTLRPGLRTENGEQRETVRFALESWGDGAFHAHRLVSVAIGCKLGDGSSACILSTCWNDKV
ncbi:hypothetical protein [Desulfosporosinus fructosivorans]